MVIHSPEVATLVVLFLGAISIVLGFALVVELARVKSCVVQVYELAIAYGVLFTVIIFLVSQLFLWIWIKN